MKTYLLIISTCLIYFSSSSQVFIDDGLDGSLYITDASGGNLTFSENSSSHIALYVDSSITIEGTFMNVSAEVQLTGNFSNTGSFSSTGDEVFIGGDSQVITGVFINDDDFYNLIINKDTGTIVQLGANIEINTAGTLNLNQGLIQTTPSNYVYIKNTNTGAILNAGVNGSLDKFIEGELRRAIVSGFTYDFPIGGSHIDDEGGDGVQYVSMKSNNGDGVIAVVFNDSSGIGVLDSMVICPSGTGDYQDVEYRITNGSWNIMNPGGGITNYNVTLHPIDFTDNGYVDYTILKNGFPSGRDKCDGIATNLPITDDSLTSFSIFEVAASENTSLLPIKLVFFEASITAVNTVKLDWQTASEINNDFFSIERSIDALDWETIERIEGAGNSFNLSNYALFDNRPFLGVSYYRLKQTDFDGQFEYSKIRAVTIQNLQILIYPNPATNQVTIDGNSLELGDITIYNILGEELTSFRLSSQITDSKLVLDLSKLAKGTYFIKTKLTGYNRYKLCKI